MWGIKLELKASDFQKVLVICILNKLCDSGGISEFLKTAFFCIFEFEEELSIYNIIYICRNAAQEASTGCKCRRAAHLRFFRIYTEDLRVYEGGKRRVCVSVSL